MQSNAPGGGSVVQTGAESNHIAGGAEAATAAAAAAVATLVVPWAASTRPPWRKQPLPVGKRLQQFCVNRDHRATVVVTVDAGAAAAAAAAATAVAALVLLALFASSLSPPCVLPSSR